MNASNETHMIKVFGNYFTFKPQQIKLLDDAKGMFITNKRAHLGFIEVDPKFEDVDYKASAEGKKELEKLRTVGVKRRIDHLKSIVRNNTESLGQDLKMANIETDPRAFWSEEMIEPVELLQKYQDAKEDEMQKRLDRIKKMESKLGYKERK